MSVERARTDGLEALLDYELPEERIALYPAAERDAARLLVVERHGAGLEHRRVGDLPDLLDPGDLLVVNDSRVFPARLRGRRPDGREVEILLTERVDLQDGAREGREGRPERARERWAVLARIAGRVRHGEVWDLGRGMSASLIGRMPDERLEVEIGTAGGRTVLELAAERGETPLPPYIRRPVDREVDPERYQTVFAREAGSCAAPTAGLHFTERLLARLRERGVAVAPLTLHVGWATFRPLRPEDPFPPAVPPEPFDLPEETARAISCARAAGRRVVAVGTTVARVLEERSDPNGGVRPGRGKCGLMIGSGHRFRAVDALLTNFHLPRTTLLLLVAAFAGEASARAAYEAALRNGYRFYSYGDAMLVRPARSGRGEE
jgi:S-adenosylmethionine:tRNA ribosyltransferase-isomerase